MPSSATVTITATSVADSTKTADATVTIAKPIAISPETTSVQAGVSLQFASSVNFSSNTAVEWQVEGVSGGNSNVGTITTAGYYTAPNAIPASNPVTVTVVSKADSSKTASATVTIEPPDIVISPSTTTLAAGSKQVFAATVLSKSVKPTWQLECGGATSGACGSIDINGNYTAPASPPRFAVVQVIASMEDGSARYAKAVADIQFGNASLSGRYLLQLASPPGRIARARTAVLTTDGAGHISGGTIDDSESPGAPQILTGGTYSVASDGRGTAKLEGSFGTINLAIVLANNSYAFATDLDSATGAATGSLELQQSESLNSGEYVLSLTGQLVGSNTTSVAAAGSFTVATGGMISGGVIDRTQGGVLSTEAVVGGSLTAPDMTGRGSMVLATTSGQRSFAYFVMDEHHAKVIAIDGRSIEVGEVAPAQAKPVSANSLIGRYGFTLAGTTNSTPFAMVGTFTLDEAHSVTDIQFDGLAQTVFDFNPGAYDVSDPATGRMVAAWTANNGFKLQYVMYPRSDGSVVILETDGTYAASGIARKRGADKVSNLLQLGGAFSMRFEGDDLASNTQTASTGAATAVTSAATYSMSGALDAIDSQGVAFALHMAGLNEDTQRYVFGTSSSTLGDGSLYLYRIDDNQAFVIFSNGSKLLTGEIRRQY